MKALSIRQPWAWLIATGQKDVENRSWKTSFRGRIYIHAGKTMDVNVPGSSLTEDWILERLDVYRRAEYQVAKRERGAIIGEVDIVDCRFFCGDMSPRLFSKWHEVGYYGFYLANPVLYDTPIPCKGQLGFFEVVDGAVTAYSKTFRND